MVLVARDRRQRIGVAVLVGATVLTSILSQMDLFQDQAAAIQMPMVQEAVENVERAWARGPAHEAIQQMKRNTLIHKHSWLPFAIVFVHVPRTGGDALATHLFPTDDLYLGSAWSRDFPTLYDDLKGTGETQWDFPKRRSLFKGFLSGADILRLQESWKESWTSVRMFTVLRDPVERCISTIHHIRENHLIGGELCNNSVRAYLNGQGCLDGKKREVLDQVKRQRAKIHSFMNNSLTYQLGDYLNSTMRSVSPERAVENAKALLRNMTFIGFYEDWQQDYYRLKRTVFYDFENEKESLLMSAVGAFRRILFWIGTIAGRLRMVTRKYASEQSESDLQLVNEMTHYDLEVYNYARKLVGRPIDPYYKSYAQYFLREGLPILFASLAFVVAVCRCCCFCCSGKKV